MRSRSHFNVLCIGVVLLHCLRAASQTNDESPLIAMFSVPGITLRAPPFSASLAVSQPSGAITSQASESHPLLLASLTNSGSGKTQDTILGELSSDNFNSDFERKLFSRIEKGGYFGGRAPVPVNVLDKVVDNIFRPEIIHAGKTTVSCSLVAAIKRKNPLCLINPVFFQWCW